MSTTSITNGPLPDADAPIQPVIAQERLKSWWHTPTTLTVFGLIALIGFGILAPGGSWDSTLHIATDRDLLAVPDIAVPAQLTSVILAVVCLVIAGVTWWLAFRYPVVRPALRATLLVLFGIFWVLSFLVWIVVGQTLDLTALLQSTLALAVPLVFGSLSGVLSERAGVVNIAIEGQLLFGAFGAAILASMTGNPWLGIIAAPIMALVIGVLLALFAVGYHVQQIIVGVVLNVLAIGLTSFFFSTVMKAHPEMLNTPTRLPNLPIPGLSHIPLIGPVLFNQNILVYLMYVIVVVLTVALYRTRWGLRVRAVGEHPLAADTVGINVSRTRWSNVLLGSAVAGLGGATLTIGTGVAFGEEMSAGKGYIALAAMILGRYNPIGAVCAALFFAFADALQLRLGILKTVAVPDGLDKFTLPGEFLLMLPYIVTLFAVAGFVGRVRVPAADGEPYIKQ
ncbi:ABC transporter permease [Devriesea agamarum]|uniref:ABC transporter permease n=1 Tax=Devriesea agamarum TaxID=472569 RepID=UPI00071D47AB|nr:ABC transporter permease [Devriesea agamarum]